MSSLEGRVPAPPAVFVGREQDRRRLAVLLGRHRSVSVVAAGGLGKTALALTVLHHAFAASIDETRWIAARSNTALGRALGAAMGLAEESVSLLFLHAESHALRVVIDDAHQLDREQLSALYAMVERYATRSQWLILTQHAPEPTPDRVLLSLDALTFAELDALAAQLDPTRAESERARIVRAAAGSPLRLKLALSGALSLERALPEPSRPNRLLLTLRWLSHPVPTPVLASVHDDFDREFADVSTRSLLESAARGLRLHDEARALLGSAQPMEEPLRRSLAAALLATDDPALWLEALRVLCFAGERALVDCVLDGLDARGAALLAAGLARAVATIAQPIDHRRAKRWLLRALTQFPSTAMIDALEHPDVRDADACLDYAVALFRVGRMNDCARVCDESAAFASAERRFDLALLRATTEAVQGQLPRAIALAEQLEPALERQAFARDCYLSRGYALSGRAELASRLIDRWCEVAPLPAVESATALQLAYAAGLLGRVRDARALLARIEGSRSYDRWSLLLGTLHVELEAGRLDRAVALSEQLQLEWAASGYLAPMLEFVALCVAIERGAWDGVPSRLASIARGLEASEDRQTLALCDALSDELATSGIAGIDAIDRPPLNAGAMFNRWRRALLRGDVHGEPPFVPENTAPADLRTSVLAHAARAQLAALREDFAAAIEEIDRARVIAQRAGLVRMSFAVERSGALLAAQRRDDLRLAQHGQRFLEFAAEMPSRRAGAWARFCELCASEEPPSPSRWLALARLDAELSVLITALLGGRAQVDRWQRAVIEGIASRWASTRYVVSPAGASIDRDAWVLDVTRSIVTLSDRAELDLSRAAQTLALIELLALEGAASKQRLAERVWGVRGYNRLRDDKRIEVAVRKLRIKIESEPSNPRRLKTERDGYTLSEEAPLVALLPRATAADDR